jgi:DNA-binding transcriptional ArsR family regulator
VSPSTGSRVERPFWDLILRCELPRIRIGGVATHPRRPIVNTVGDLVLAEPRALLALAAPARLRIFDSLRRDGPLSAAALAAALDEDGAAVEAALAEFEACGLAVAEDGKWCAAGRGFVFEMPNEPEGQEAARQLANAVLLQYVDLPRRWLEDDEPRLPVDWLRASGAFNARMSLTPDELREFQAGLELLIEPYATRKAADTPEDAASVRILAYFMPEALDP